MLERAEIFLRDFFGSKNNIAIWGFGREGKSTFGLIRRLLPDKAITVIDSSTVDLSGYENTSYCPAEGSPSLKGFDLVMKSPGIAVDTSVSDIAVLSSQTELFLSLFRSRVIGVTGTKGKSTTSSLIYHIIKGVKENTVFCGNIGIPCFDMLDKIDESTTIVFEMSCHQLEFTDVSPSIAVVLNLHEDHLDHYITYENYIRAKSHIFAYQEADDFVLLNIADKDIQLSFGGGGEHIYLAQADCDLDADISVIGRELIFPFGSLTVDKDDTLLEGSHNLYNIAVAYYICHRCFGVDSERFISLLRTFSPLPHRLQKVGEFGGVAYYDDSISTICESAINAVKALGNVQTIILGGMDRGIDYSELISALCASDIDNIVLIGQTTPRLSSLLSEAFSNCGVSKRLLPADSMSSAVKLCREHTLPGRSCLLSPAAASYDMYKNFEVRGDDFAACVRLEYAES